MRRTTLASRPPVRPDSPSAARHASRPAAAQSSPRLTLGHRVESQHPLHLQARVHELSPAADDERDRLTSTVTHILGRPHEEGKPSIRDGGEVAAREVQLRDEAPLAPKLAATHQPLQAYGEHRPNVHVLG